jgi:hypothetical protein
MKRKTLFGAIMVVLLAAATVVSAGVGNNPKNGWQVNGAHYNLNILGMDKHGEVGDSNGHTMFVLLNGKTKIVMTQDGNGFRVVDRNGLDGKAKFNIAPGHYNIYAIARGKQGNAHIDAYGNFTDAVEGTKLILLGYVDISREKGKPQSLNINELFYVDVTLCTTVVEGVCTEWVVYEDYWVFDIDELLEYYWDYTNDGIKNLQVRFYECTLDETGTADDYCRWANGDPIVSSKRTVVPS